MERSAREPIALDGDLYRMRRERVLELLGERSVLVLTAAPELRTGRDGEVRYAVDPELYYLTGYSEPEAVVVLAPDHDTPFTMFVRPRDAARELWTGARGGVEAACSAFGAQQAFPVHELGQKLPGLLADADVIYARLDGGRAPLDELLRNALAQGRRTRPRNGRGPHTLTDPGVLLDELRIIKDAREIELLRQAAAHSVAGFKAALPFIRPNAGEWQVEAALEAGFRAGGADGVAFPTIVAAGANATILHYTSNDGSLRGGDLVLVDAGARYRNYCGDISRTFPVNGEFSAAQRTLYDAVLRGHDAALAKARSGSTTDEMHSAALRELLAVLKDLGLLGDVTVDQALEDAETYKRFCPHKTSHWLGLETHDVGAYAFSEGARPLEPGMVLTVEPGLYIQHDCLEAPPELRGVGIRIEDDVLITATGPEVLTAALPTRAHLIEAMLREQHA